jgi:hypothetical protein
MVNEAERDTVADPSIEMHETHVDPFTSRGSTWIAGCSGRPRTLSLARR